MPRPFTTHSGIAAAMRIDNVDTDVIIPLIYTVTYPKHALGPFAFHQLRYLPDGSENPAFILNRPQFRGSSILIAGNNFGCGSSREWAVNAVDATGIRVMIAPSFGDIFSNNCIKNGLLPLPLEQTEVQRLMDEADQADGGHPFSVDLESQTLTTASGRTVKFDYDPAMRERLLAGKDEIDLTLELDPEIRAYQQRAMIDRPWLTVPAING